jgi:hypothetical protein
MGLNTSRAIAENLIPTAITKYWPPVLAKKNTTCSLPDHENECQWSCNDLWPCIKVNQSEMWPLMAIYNVVTSFVG